MRLLEQRENAGFVYQHDLNSPMSELLRLRFASPTDPRVVS
jgi:hypothetical protein